MTPRHAFAAGSAALGLAGGAALAQTDDTGIEEALSAAPPQLRETAVVRAPDGTLLREGDGRFTCSPGPEGFAGPMCLDAEWMRWFEAYRQDAPFEAERLGIAYMLAGDSPEGGASNIDPRATTPDAGNDWVVEGPHVMLIAPDGPAFDALPVRLDVPGPYVMWAGTDFEHVMLPVGERPEQRPLPDGEDGRATQ